MGKPIQFLHVHPSGWLSEDKTSVYWPHISFETERKNPDSKYELNWIPNVIVKLWHTELTKERAEDMVDYHLSHSESEHAQDSDDHPSKKKKRISHPKELQRNNQPYELTHPKS